jgi:hypothetical protein
VSERSLKLYFYMFKRSQGKHNSLDYHFIFLEYFHYLQSLYVQSLTHIKKNHVQSSQTSRVDSHFFKRLFFLSNVHHSF